LALFSEPARPCHYFALGAAPGFAVNYTPDHATIHDRDGRITHALERAYQLGATRWWV
jgi:hypothetical protein